MDYEKTYVAVWVRVSAEGKLTPKTIEWEDGRKYEVTHVTGVRVQPPSYVGGTLTELYDCIVDGTRKQLYLETDSGRWFVEKPIG